MALAFGVIQAALPAGSSAAGGVLSPRLADLAAPGLRSAPPARQAAGIGLPHQGPGSLLREGDRVLVEAHFEHGAAAGVEDLRAAGARIVDVSPRYQTVTMAAKPAELRAVGSLPRVVDVSEVLTPVVAATECQGLATSEGDAQLEAASARSAFGVDGSGVGVGILSDSFDRDVAARTHAAEDVGAGDLPGAGNPCGHPVPVGVLDDSAKATGLGDEGRAMAQIVHDLAPGAALSFATAFKGETSFAGNIERLALPAAAGGAGASVIADDVFYLEEPFFQDGPVAAAINGVTANGVAYFSAAGNNNILDAGADVASYQAPFRDAETCPTGVPAIEGTHCMDFDPGADVDDAYDLEVEPGVEVQLDLQWAEPWFGVQTDLNAYLLDESGAVLAESANANKTKPFEFLPWKNKGTEPALVRLAIPRRAGAASPTLKFVQIGNGSTGVVPTPEQLEASADDEIGPTILGHSGAAAAVSVAAVRYDDGLQPEPYSSRGPVRHYFAPVNGSSAAPELIPSQAISKPDLAATDCGRTSFFRPTKALAVFRFCGTSAAAPHAAAVAALMRQSNPALSYPQLRFALSATARPVGAFGADAVGAGLIDAYQAVNRVTLPPAITITERPLPLSKIRKPSIGFAANRPVRFGCSVDGGDLQPCSSPFVPSSPLADGLHGFVVRGIDAAGHAGSSELVSFKIDSKRPRTFFRKHPRKTIRTQHRKAKAVFRFGSNERDVTFVCKVDAGFLRFCRPRLVKRFRVGKHVVWVKARDAAGNLDRSPAVYRFEVR